MWKRDWKYLIPILYPWNIGTFQNTSREVFEMDIQRIHFESLDVFILLGLYSQCCVVIFIKPLNHQQESLRFWEAHRIIQTNYNFQNYCFARTTQPAPNHTLSIAIPAIHQAVFEFGPNNFFCTWISNFKTQYLISFHNNI